MRRTLLVLVVGFVLASPSAKGQTNSFLNRRMTDWQEQLEKGKTPAARRSAAFALGRMGTWAGFAIPNLIKRIRDDSDPLVRDMAANAVGDIVLSMKDFSPNEPWNQAGPMLQKALIDDKDPRVRRSAAYALGAFGELAAPAVPALTKALRDEKPIVRQNAAWALGRVGPALDAAAGADLCAALSDDNALVRRDAAAALGMLGRTGRGMLLRPAGKALLDMVKRERDEVVRKTVLGALATLTGPEHAASAPDLYPLLDSKEVETAQAAAYALANMRGEPARKALPILRQALADPDSAVQALAAVSLANAGAEAAPAIEDLARVLSHSPDTSVRRNCVIALGHLGPAAKNAIPALAAALKPVPDAPAESVRANEEVREVAAEAIAQVHFPGNEAAFPAVREVLQKDLNPIVRHRCIWALFDTKLPDLDRHHLTRPLIAILEDTSEDVALTRYEVARLLANVLHEKAPDRTCDVLLQMIVDPGLKVFNRTNAMIQGAPDESRKGASGTTLDLGGDARFLAAEAMGALGAKARNNPRIIAALRQAAKDKEPRLREKAAASLKALGLTEE